MVHKTNELSIEFSRIIKSWHTPEQLSAIDAENLAEPNHCASHNYYDAIAAILEAFETVMGRENDADSKQDNDMIDDAWDASRLRGFA
jgi:hypothetical protein|tara:strand:- start:46 stop:309 length:264 start_codon:yes stop_codon:yes gene_type:complete